MSADHLNGSTYGSTDDQTVGAASPSTPVKEQAQQTAGTAANEGAHVAGVARDEAQRVAAEAKSQASSLISETVSQVEDHSRTQRDRLVETLRGLGDDLDQMASQNSGGMAADLAREGASRARSVSSRLDGREPRELLDDVRAFARRKPGTFLLGALAAGVVAGRLTRGAKDGSDTAGTSTATDTSASGSLDPVYPAYPGDPATAAHPTTIVETGPTNPAVGETTISGGL